MNSPWPAYMTVRTCARYFECGVRKVRYLLKEGLPHVRLGANGSIRVPRREADRFVQKFAAKQDDLEEIVEDIMREL